MKTYKYLLLLIPVLCLTSCLFEENNVFDESPAVRMQKAIDEYKSFLKDAPNGWVINYYPELKYGVGGYAIYCNFREDKDVEAACEIATHDVAPFETVISKWDIISYQGPVLTFDTYNPVIHYFSEVSSSSDRDGRAGDYDFVITRAVKDTFYLTGLKNENKMIMYKCPEDPIEYLRKVNALAANTSMFKTFNIVQNGDSVGAVRISSTITNSLMNRTLTASYSLDGRDTTITFPFFYTPTELRLQKPLEINGTSIEVLTWDAENRQYVASGTDNITLPYVGAKVFLYEDFLGEYNLYYSTSNATPANRNKSLTVSLVQESYGGTYRLEGLRADNAPGKLIVNYVDGQIEVLGQIMHTYPDTKYDFWLLPYSYVSNGSSYTSRTTTYGIKSKKIEEVDGKIQFDLDDNGVWTGYGGTSGFILRDYNGSTNVGNVNGKDGQYRYHFWRLEKL